MKRFILLLIILAGGLAAAAFTIPTNAATVNGSTISQDQLNSDLTAIANSPDYQCYLAAQVYGGSNGQAALPPVNGVVQTEGSGQSPTVTTAYASTYLDSQIGSQVLYQQAAERHLHVTAKEMKTATKQVTSEITQIMSEIAPDQSQISECATLGTLTGAEVLATMPASFVDELARYQATGELLVESILPPTSANLMKFYTANQSEFDTVCYSLAGFPSQSDAETAYKQATSGTPFSQVASASPALSGGGAQKCLVFYGLAASLTSGTNISSVTDITTLKDNTVTQPFTNDQSYFLLEITSRVPTSFANAKSAVTSALVQSANANAENVLKEEEKNAKVVVNARYGTWKPSSAEVLVPTTPAVNDVLNPVVNDPATASTGASSSSSGSTSSPTGSSG